MKRVVALLTVLASSVGTWLVLNSSDPPIITETPKAPSVLEIKLQPMSWRDKISNLLILHSPGTDIEKLQQFAETHQVGGMILMSDNIPTDLSIMSQISAAIIGTDSNFPRLIAIDQEGDTVKRLKTDIFPGALTLKNLPVEATTEAFKQRGEMLKQYGLNLNFGIVADVPTSKQSFTYDRALGINYSEAKNRVTSAIMATKGLTLSTIKHFPGHGAAEGDSHFGIPASTKTLEDWLASDALPFQAGIDAGVDVVMFGHLRFNSVDEKPASLSGRWHEVLHNDLGFTGVTITDDLAMLQNSGDEHYADPIQNAIEALRAGNTLLLFIASNSNDTSPERLIDGILSATENDTELQEAINQAVKKSFKLRENVKKLL